jgi:hypothetical protein
MSLWGVDMAQAAQGRVEWKPIFAIFVGVPVVITIVGALVFAAVDRRTPSQRITDACREQYPGDDDGAQQCVVTLLSRTLLKERDDQLNRAASQAGVN